MSRPISQWRRISDWVRVIGLLLLGGVSTSLHAEVQKTAASRFVMVVGAPGEPVFATNFIRQASAWASLAEKTGGTSITLGVDPFQTNDLEQLQTLLSVEAKEELTPLLLILLGHGTYDGRDAKFNLRGLDLTATILSQWLEPIKRPLVIIHTGSSSAPFLKALSKTNRIVITATRSGHEQNATRLGAALTESLEDPSNDLDQDGETSLLEVFLGAATRVTESYKNEGRLATEHSLLDDNGDGLGTPAEWFRGVRTTKKATGGNSLDGIRAHQLALKIHSNSPPWSAESRARRDELEQAIARLREKRPKVPDEDYYHQLEVLLLEIARLSVETDK